jgi:hypothetical protein
VCVSISDMINDVVGRKVCVCVRGEDSMELSDGSSVSISDMIDDVVGRKVCVFVLV